MKARKERVLQLNAYKLPHHASPRRSDIPPRIADIPFVQDLTDLTKYICKAFVQKNVQVKFVNAVVPNFYRRRVLANGMRPQQYVARIASILAEMLPDGSSLTIDVKPDCFVFQSPAIDGPLWLDESKIWFEGGKAAADSELIAVCYTLWNAHDLVLNPLAFSVPDESIERIQSKMGGDALYRIQELLAANTKMRMRRLSYRNITAITELVRRSTISSLVWAKLKVRDGEIGFASLAAVFRDLLPSKRNTTEIAPSDTNNRG